MSAIHLPGLARKHCFYLRRRQVRRKDRAGLLGYGVSGKNHGHGIAGIRGLHAFHLLFPRGGAPPCRGASHPVNPNKVRIQRYRAVRQGCGPLRIVYAQGHKSQLRCIIVFLSAIRQFLQRLPVGGRLRPKTAPTAAKRPECFLAFGRDEQRGRRDQNHRRKESRPPGKIRRISGSRHSRRAGEETNRLEASRHAKTLCISDRVNNIIPPHNHKSDSNVLFVSSISAARATPHARVSSGQWRTAQKATTGRSGHTVDVTVRACSCLPRGRLPKMNLPRRSQFFPRPPSARGA